MMGTMRNTYHLHKDTVHRPCRDNRWLARACRLAKMVREKMGKASLVVKSLMEREAKVLRERALMEREVKAQTGKGLMGAKVQMEKASIRAKAQTGKALMG